MASRSLADADPALSGAYLAARNEYEAATPGHEVIVTCTYRSPAEQQALYAQGRTKPGPIVTQLDGVTQLSNHNVRPSRALDFAIVIQGKITWHDEDYVGFGVVAERYGLVWGGDWPHFKDYPHLELPKA